MCINFIEISRDIYLSKGLIGLLSEWIHTIAEIPGHAIIERINQLHQKYVSPILLASGVAAIVAGSSGSIITLMNPGHENLPIWQASIMFFSSFLAICGIYLFQYDFVHPKAIYGFFTMSIGLIFQFFHLPSGVTSFIHLTGMVLIALTTVNIKKFTTFPALLWLGSPLVGLPAFFFGGVDNVLFKLGAMIFGLGFVFFGVNILQERFA